MKPARLLVWGILGLVCGVALWIIVALVGLNFVPEGDPMPWFLRALQWLGVALILAGIAAALWALLLFDRKAKR